MKEAEDDELEEISLVSLSSEENKVDVSSLSNEESLSELSLQLLWKLVILLDLFSWSFYISFSNALL